MKCRGPDRCFPPRFALVLKIVDPHPVIFLQLVMFLPTLQPIIELFFLKYGLFCMEFVLLSHFLFFLSSLSLWFLFQTHYTVPDTEKDLQSLIATIECEQPQPDLYKYELILCVAKHTGTNSVHRVSTVHVNKVVCQLNPGSFGNGPG